MFARDLGVDIWSAIDAAATKPFGFMRFTPGPGVGGHCLPIDPSYLAWRVERRLGHELPLRRARERRQQHMPDYVVAAASSSMLNDEERAVNGSRVLLLGLAYKAGTSDWRESPSMAIAERLLELGADVRAHDPLVPGRRRRSGCRSTRVDVHASTSSRPPTSSCCSSTTPSCRTTTIVDHARLVLDTKGVLRGRAFRGEVL